MPLLLAGLAAAPASSQYPVAEVLNSMRSACALTIAAPEGVTKLTQAGWAPASVQKGDWVDRALNQEAEIYGSSMPRSTVLTSTVSGHQLFAFLNTVHTPDSTLRLCSVQDPSAKFVSAAEQITQWAGRPSSSPELVDPVMAADLEKITFMKNWKPGLDGVSNDTTISYVPPKYVDVRRGQTGGGLSYSTELEVKAK